MKYFLLLTSAFLLLLTFESCNKCKDVNCNTGTCDDGTCQCPAGFSGSNCEVEDLCISQAIECENDGVCVDGVCDCEKNYKGDNCQDYCLNGQYKKKDAFCQCYPGWEGSGCTKESRLPWIGQYIYNSNCNQSGGAYYIDSLEHPDEDSAFAKNYVRIENLSSNGDTKGYGIIDGDSLYIPRQSVTAENGDKFRVESVKAAALDVNNDFQLIIERYHPASQGTVICTHTYAKL